MSLPGALRLPLRFDVDPLLADLARLRPADWLPHFNTAYYEGDWSGVPLRSVGGRADRLYPDPAAEDPYADTEVLARCPAHISVLSQLRCELTAVRLLRLGPGASVREHRDYRLGFEDGEVRLHVPVTTTADAEFVLDGKSRDLRPGDCWYVNVNRPHRVANRGEQPRVHLVVDCVVNPWLRELMYDAARSDRCDNTR
jgi:mannose-6-phosphate isomerase-like protein (cupin superfamily)